MTLGVPSTKQIYPEKSFATTQARRCTKLYIPNQSSAEIQEAKAF